MGEKKSDNKKKRMTYTALMLICIIVFLFALYKVIGIIIQYKNIDDYYKNAKDDFMIQ